ncbi:hypothetical protein V8E51_000344 [Hyaloscypha variabilis]
MSLAFSPRFVHIARLALPATLLVLIFYSTLSPSRSSSSFSLGFSSSGRKSAFISAAVQTEIDGPFDNSSLVELCASRKWTQGLIFKCEAHRGGIVEARNVMLNCLRFAIEAGATNFIIPEIATEGPSRVPFSHFFDLPYFTITLSSSCPQITIIPHTDDLWDKPSTSPALAISPNHFPSTPQLPLLHNSILAKPEDWTSAFKSHLNDTHPRPPSSQLPILVNLSPPPLLQFPMSYDSPHFIANFGKLVRTNEELRTLAGAVLYAFSQTHNLNIRPSRGIERAKFYGASLSSHLRPREVSPRTLHHSRPLSVSELSHNFITSAIRFNLTTIYLSTPQPSPSDPLEQSPSPDLTTLLTLATNASLSLSTAVSLLGGPLPLVSVSPESTSPSDPEPTLLPSRPGAKGFESEWLQYQSLTPAQKEAIDFEVLIRGTQFGGEVSSLGWGVALRRHIITSGGAGRWRGLVAGEVGGKGVAGKGGRGGKRRGKRVVGGDPESDRAEEAQERKMAPKTRLGSKERSFRDELSVLFGAEGEGAAWELGGWP